MLKTVWHSHFALIVSAALLAGATGCLARPVPRDEADLRKLLADAIAAGARRVRIPPGEYRLKVGPSGRAHVLFENVRDMTIDARGVTFVITEAAKAPFVAFYGCSDVTLIGLTVDCDPLQFTQGRIIGMAEDRNWYDLKIDEGYRSDAEAFSDPRPMSVFDPDTREWKLNVPDIRITKIAPREGGRIWRIHPVKRNRAKYPIAIGDPAAIPYFGRSALTCRKSVNITFKDVTIYQSGSMAFHEHAGGGNTRLTGCKVLRKPGTNRLLSTNADGFHCKNMAKGPTVEECVFEGMHDDGINIHAMLARVLSGAGKEVLVVPYYFEWSGPGDKVEFYSSEDASSLGIYTVKSCERTTDPALRRRARERFDKGHRYVYRMTLDRPVKLATGDGMASLNYIGSDYVVRGCTFRNIRYRGVLAKAHRGVIENNRFIACANTAITLTPDLFDEGPYSRDVVVRGNYIERCGKLPYPIAGHGILVYASNWHKHVAKVTAHEHANIVIENNVIKDVPRDGIYVRGVKNVTIRGNRLSRIGRRRTARGTPVAIRVENSEGVTLTDNSITDTADESARIVTGE